MSIYLEFFKSLIDFLGALIMFITLFPLLILLCIVIILESRGNPIFSQVRIGKNGKPFTMFKLRSMRLGSEEKGPYFTSNSDSRITKVGSFLRKTSLDETPQLLNILLGQMSFIGPRPVTLFQKDRYDQDEWRKRHLIKPGITGLAQVTKRSLGTEEERTSFDLQYVKEVSFLLDMIISLKTIKVVFLRKNVN